MGMGEGKGVRISARMTSKGRVTIPKKVRVALGLKPGDRISFVRMGFGKFRLVVLPRL